MKVAQLHKDSGSNRGAQIILVSVSLQQEPEKGSETSLSQALPTLGFALANEATCKSQSHAIQLQNRSGMQKNSFVVLAESRENI